MKKAISFSMLLISLIILPSCNDKDDEDLSLIKFESTAKILGRDTAICACCGNWILKIDGIDNAYQFVTLPASSNINLETVTFPVSVKINWSIDESSACKFVVVEAIELN
jgi:hypothetical protein